jgi:hypothetical protein
MQPSDYQPLTFTLDRKTVSQYHEQAQTAIQRVLDPTLMEIRKHLKDSAALLYRAYTAGHLNSVDSMLALEYLSLSARALVPPNALDPS